MEQETKPPVVEPQYEGPTPREQSIWNVGIYSVILLVGLAFILVILVAVLVL